MTELQQRTRAQILKEIDMRERTINKFHALSFPIHQALNELNRQLTHERQMIDSLVKELKSRPSDG